MLRRITTAMVGLGLVGLMAVPAGAASGTPNPRPFTGTTSYTFDFERCSFVHQVYDGTFPTRHHRTGSFHLAGCVALQTDFPYSGTFTVQLGHRTLTGTVAGTIEAATLPCAPFHFTLTVTGSGRPHRATGSIAVNGLWCGRGQIPAVDDPISGEVTFSRTQ